LESKHVVAIYTLNISHIMRSHELYKNDVAHDMHANFTKKFRERYLTSNAYITVTDAQNKSQTVPIGCESLLLTILIFLTRVREICEVQNTEVSTFFLLTYRYH
jgi:hypothetical protein